MITISIYNQKGGSAKTFTTYNLAGSLADEGYRVLLVDTDGQLNLTRRVLMYTEEFDFEKYFSICSLLNGEVQDIHEVIVNAKIPKQINWTAKDVGIDIIPSSTEIYAYASGIEDIQALKNNLKKVNDEYDFCLIDCSPFKHEMTYAIMNASDYLICPMLPSFDYIDGYGSLIDTINDVKINLNENLKFLGFFFSNFSNWKKQKELYEQCLEFGDLFLKTTIPRSADVANSEDNGIPLIWYRPNKKVTIAFQELKDAILKKIL